MINNEDRTTIVLHTLNQLLKLDVVAINDLFDTDVVCNAELADSPFIVTDPAGRTSVLGVINGLMDQLQLGRVAVIINDDGWIEKFVPYAEFQKGRA